MIDFPPLASLIRGPSETGKSYIRDCLWYLLGGDRAPKTIPEDSGYQHLALQFASEGESYLVVRSLKGGGARIFSTLKQPEAESDDLVALGAGDPTEQPDLPTSNSAESPLIDTSVLDWVERPLFEWADSDPSNLIVSLSGAAHKLILRSASRRGPVTGSDLRHWSLVAQPAMISEAPTSGTDHGQRPQRMAALNLFLTGSDDSAYVLVKSSRELDQIQGQITSAETALQRVMAGIDSKTSREEVIDAIERVDQTLEVLSRQYASRAAQLKDVRASVAELTPRLKKAEARREHSRSMVERFDLLAKKYQSDLDRLGAIREGVELFSDMSLVPCPLCFTPPEGQGHALAPPPSPKLYQAAAQAEATKILALSDGLAKSKGHEVERYLASEAEAKQFSTELYRLEQREAAVLGVVRGNSGADPKVLAIRRSDLSSQLDAWEESARLAAEIERLKVAKKVRPAKPAREAGGAGESISTLAKAMLVEWGCNDVQSVHLDMAAGDLEVNHRARLSYGAGTRSLYLSALTIAVMQHAMRKGYPHLGVVVLDSPLKAYADPKSPESARAKTVTESFYSWLSKWDGPGQLVVLENEEAPTEFAERLSAVQFTRRNDDGRAGFYLKTSNPAADEAEPARSESGNTDSS